MILEKRIQPHSVREPAGNRFGAAAPGPLHGQQCGWRSGERRGRIITPKSDGSFSRLIYEIQHLLASVSLTPPLLQGRA